MKPKVKKFLRGYHEIRLNLRETSYIPKFDDLEISDMIKELSQAEGNPEDHYRSTLSESQIRDSFTALIKRHTRQLERDLVEAFS